VTVAAQRHDPRVQHLAMMQPLLRQTAPQLTDTLIEQPTEPLHDRLGGRPLLAGCSTALGHDLHADRCQGDQGQFDVLDAKRDADDRHKTGHR